MLAAGGAGPMHNELHEQVSNFCEIEGNWICHSCPGTAIHHGEGVGCLATKTGGSLHPRHKEPPGSFED